MEIDFVIENNILVKYKGNDTDVIIPNGVKEIGSGAFKERRIPSIRFPESLEKIGNEAFLNCTNLKNVKLPESLTEIGQHAFSGCTSLLEIEIPKRVKRIEYGTFWGCTSLRKITIPVGVEYIGLFAFSSCTDLEEIVIPETVETITSESFEDCRNLKTVNYLNDQGIIACDAFDGCIGLFDENGLLIVANTLCICDSKKENVVIPEGVKTIASGVFRGRRSRYRDNKYSNGTILKTVQLPSSLETIGNYAFEECDQLEELTIPKNVTHIGDEAFRNCRALKTVILSKSFGDFRADIFDGCNSLTTIKVDEDNPFYSFRDGILFSKSGDTIFYVPGGKNIKEYEIPDDVKIIADQAFIECCSLKKISIPATVESIGNKIFPRERYYQLDEIIVSPRAGSKQIEMKYLIFPGRIGLLFTQNFR